MEVLFSSVVSLHSLQKALVTCDEYVNIDRVNMPLFSFKNWITRAEIIMFLE